MLLFDGPRQPDDLACAARHQRKHSLRRAHAGWRPKHRAKPPDFDSPTSAISASASAFSARAIGLFRPEGARRTSQESFRSNEIAELCHRDASKCARRRLVTQGDPVQCVVGITVASARRRSRDQQVHLNPATLVTPAVQCPVLIYLLTKTSTYREQRTGSRKQKKINFEPS
jgi:hypothetical protein